MPCIATNISVAPGCINNSADVSWSGPKGAVQYHVSASSSQNNATCNSSELHCTLTRIMCGTTYTVNVKAFNGDCSSEPSLALTFSSGMRWRTIHTCTLTCTHANVRAHTHTTRKPVIRQNRWFWLPFLLFFFPFPAPCAPSNVTASLLCPNSTHVTWVRSPSATAYNVTAVGQDGRIHDCNTNSASCQIPNMHCGQNYNITVIPYADSCAGNPSIPYQFVAGTEREQDLKSKNYVLSE